MIRSGLICMSMGSQPLSFTQAHAILHLYYYKIKHLSRKTFILNLYLFWVMQLWSELLAINYPLMS